MKRWTLQSPMDMHVHFRDDDMLRLVAPMTAKRFSGALVMPNLVQPITTIEQVIAYKERIRQAVGVDQKFEPYMTLYFQEYSRKFLEEAKPFITAIKLYPKGMTTNSDHGCNPADPFVKRVLGYMQELDIPLCVHGEDVGFVLDRERLFHRFYEDWARSFPRLRIVMEHITDRESIELINNHDNLYATVTAHHLLITLDDVVGGLLNPHLFCKPIAKTPFDRASLRQSAIHNDHIMLGTDSAPHPQHKKECCGCAAGVFTAPIALLLVAKAFSESGGSENRMREFVSWRAQAVYGLTPPEKTVVITDALPTVVPAAYRSTEHDVAGVVPMWAGETLPWSYEE